MFGFSAFSAFGLRIQPHHRFETRLNMCEPIVGTFNINVTRAGGVCLPVQGDHRNAASGAPQNLLVEEVRRPYRNARRRMYYIHIIPWLELPFTRFTSVAAFIVTRLLLRGRLRAARVTDLEVLLRCTIAGGMMRLGMRTLRAEGILQRR